MQANLAEIQAAAARLALTRAALVAEEVEWDLNTRSAEARLAPFVYRSAAGLTFEIAQRKGAANEPGAPHSGTGTALWTAAVGLAKYLEARYPPTTGGGADGGARSGDAGGGAGGGLVGQRCLELGCGTGLVSLVAASLGACVVATDIPDIIHGHAQPNLDANLLALKARGEALVGSVEAKPLIWGETPLAGFGEDWDLVRCMSSCFACVCGAAHACWLHRAAWACL
jgi:hypothetical protein